MARQPRNKDAVSAYNRRYRLEHPEVVKSAVRRWRDKNLARTSEYNKIYRLENANSMLEAQRRWRKNNPEKSNESSRSWEKRNPDKVAAWRKGYAPALKKARLKREYGITPEQYNEMVLAQNHLCKICKKSNAGGRSKDLRIDHDHKTGKVRGLLCNSCNLSLGHFGDSIELLEAAIRYLKESGS